MTKMNRKAYVETINKDIEELRNSNIDNLSKGHIELVLLWSVDTIYGEIEEPEKVGCILCDFGDSSACFELH